MWTWVWLACGVRSAAPVGACPLGAPALCFADAEARLREPEIDLAGAALRFDQACADGHMVGCVHLGLLVQDGRGATHDPARASALYERACAGGVGTGCLNLAFQYSSGNGVVRDTDRATLELARALDAFHASCQADPPQFCGNLGFVLERGYGTLPDLPGARVAYLRGCDHGEADACVNRSELELDHGEAVPEAAARLRATCEAGTGSACAALGQRLGHGVVLDRDPAEARVVLSRGCALGDAISCGELAELVGPVDPSAADTARRRACQLGSGSACEALGERALAARAIPDAARWLAAACRIGDASGCAIVGALAQNGELGAAEAENRWGWFESACTLQDPGSCVELLRAGRPLPMTDADRDVFLAEGCRRGVVEACVR